MNAVPYLTPESRDAFLDFPPIGSNLATFTHYYPNATPVLCPKCKGHGGWNLRINAYPLPKDKANIAANRHTHVHFRASCAQCNGWGYVEPGLDATCIHEDGPAVNVGNCLNNYTCTKCGRTHTVDSSD